MSVGDVTSPVGLAGLLRTWRARVDPREWGFEESPRRTPGLRRTEVAELAGISVAYLVRLEQGRAINPSPPILAALSRALRLSAEEIAMLYKAAGLAAPSTVFERSVPPSVERLVERLTDCPVAVYSTDWWLLRWNPLWGALLGDPAALTGRDRNLVWREFVSGGSRVAATRTEAQRERFRAEIVADLRAATVGRPGDRALTAMVEQLTEHSPDFGRYWRDAQPVRRRSERKRVAHPLAGVIEFDCDVLEAPASELRIVVYSTAAGSVDADRLRSLLG